MKTKLFLLTVIFAVFVVACNQPKKTNEKEPETITTEQEEVAEPVSVKGKIVNKETGDGIGMAMIFVKGTTTGTISGADGQFMITAPAGAKKLAFSADGFEPIEVEIANEKKMEVKLVPKM